MINIYIQLFVSLILSFVTYFILKKKDFLSKKYIFIDKPDIKIKVHKKPISNIGGFACLVPFLFSILVSLFFENIFSKKFIFIIFFSSILFYNLGKLDDVKNLSPNKKFIAFISIYLFLYPFENDLIIKNLEFKYLSYYFELNNYSIFFTLFCLFLFYNTSNFLDGFNGIYGSTIIFWIIFIVYKTSIISVIIFTLLISLIFFLNQNLKNKVFIGNSGNIYITCFVGALYIYAYNSTKTILCDEIFFAFLIPGLDTLRLSFERLYNKKSPFKGDNRHIHHLISKKISIKNLWLFLISLIIMPSIILHLTGNFFITLSITIILYTFIILFFGRIDKKSKFY